MMVITASNATKVSGTILSILPILKIGSILKLKIDQNDSIVGLSNFLPRETEKVSIFVPKSITITQQKGAKISAKITFEGYLRGGFVLTETL